MDKIREAGVGRIKVIMLLGLTLTFILPKIPKIHE
jgi:hypothetical protein